MPDQLPHNYKVVQRGTRVSIVLGNVELDMSYGMALKLSGWLRLRAKQAKLEDGNTDPIFTCMGDLEDLETIVRREQARGMFIPHLQG